MPCQWLIKSTREYCSRLKNKYCGQHAYAINKRGSKAPSPCKEVEEEQIQSHSYVNTADEKNIIKTMASNFHSKYKDRIKTQ